MSNQETVPLNNLSEEQRSYLINCLGRKFVISTISKVGLFYNGRQFFEDLVQEGMIGLWVASRKYDPNKSSFSTYAFYWVKAYVMEKFKKEINISKPNMIMSKRLIDENNKRFYLKYKGVVLSLNEPLGGVSDNLGEITIEDTISDPKSSEAIRYLENKQDNDAKILEITTFFNEFLKSKKDKTKDIMYDIFYNRILSEEPMALHEIGKKYGISKQRINQLEKEVLNIIFEKFSSNRKNLNSVKKKFNIKVNSKEKIKENLKNKNTAHVV